jgi:hypothetical protein
MLDPSTLLISGHSPIFNGKSSKLIMVSYTLKANDAVDVNILLEYINTCIHTIMSDINIGSRHQNYHQDLY